MASLVAQRVKHLPTIRETWVQSLGQEDPLEKEMATHSSTLAWKIPWTEKPGRLQSMGSQSRTCLRDFTFTFFHFQIIKYTFSFKDKCYNLTFSVSNFNMVPYVLSFYLLYKSHFIFLHFRSNQSSLKKH